MGVDPVEGSGLWREGENTGRHGHEQLAVDTCILGREGVDLVLVLVLI